MHVRITVSRCFVALHQLSHLRRYVTDDCFRSLVVSLVHSRLDYDNFVLVGLVRFIYSGASSLFSTLGLVWYFDYVVTTMSRTPLQLCTVCVYHNVLTSWRFGCYMVSRHHT